MTTLKEYRTHRKELMQQIKEAKATLHRLEEELDNERFDMQHEEVEHLDDYLNKAEPHLADVKKLGVSALEDFTKSIRDLIHAVKGSKDDHSDR